MTVFVIVAMVVLMDAGLRLDFLLLSEHCAGKLVAADVDQWVRDEAEASDHAPVWAKLKA